MDSTARIHYPRRVEQLWVNPNPSANPAQRHGPSLNENQVRVASELAPTTSPAPAGNALVPAGWVLQMGDEGEWDTMLADDRFVPRQYRANITQPTVPYYTGGWPPDPLIGTPGHTKPTT